jgi:hypothetical protein
MSRSAKGAAGDTSASAQGALHGGEVRKLPLSAIRVERLAQPRVSLVAQRVEDYTQDMKRGNAFPPLDVFEDSEGVFWLSDGFHRRSAALQAEVETIECLVRPGGLREAILHSCGANAVHGLRRTNEDKHRAVTKLLGDKEWARWGDREIARQCNVSNEFVGKLREQIKPASSVNVDRSRIVFRGGTTYKQDTTNIGRSRAPAPVPTERPPPSASPNPQSAPAPTPPAPTQGRLDLHPLGVTPQTSAPAPQSQQVSTEQELWRQHFEKLANSLFVSTWDAEFPGWWKFNRPSHFIKMAENASAAWASVASKLKEHDERAA